MLDALKQMCLMVGAMAGTITDKKIQELLEEQCNKTLANMDDEELSEYQQGVDQMKSMKVYFDIAVEAKAAMFFKFYSALKQAGFTPEMAIQIVVAQPFEAKS